MGFIDKNSYTFNCYLFDILLTYHFFQFVWEIKQINSSKHLSLLPTCDSANENVMKFRHD